MKRVRVEFRENGMRSLNVSKDGNDWKNLYNKFILRFSCVPMKRKNY